MDVSPDSTQRRRMVISTSPGNVSATVDHLRQLLETRKIQVLAVIDHGGGARHAGLELHDEMVVVFGDPAVGTALMQDRALVGYDLPLRMLVWDDAGTTKVAFRDPDALVEEYDLTTSEPTVERLGRLLRSLAAELAS